MRVDPFLHPLSATRVKFDVNKLVEDYNRGCQLWPATDQWPRTLLNLTKPSNLSDSEAMLYGTDHPSGDWFYNRHTGKYEIKQSDFNSYCDWINNTYTQKVCQTVTDWIKRKYNLTVGRNRFVIMKPNTCLPLHVDFDSSLRFHVPVITNDQCMFVIDNKVYRMSDAGTLYILNVHKPHTVINGSHTDRVHIIWDGYY